MVTLALAIGCSDPPIRPIDAPIVADAPSDDAGKGTGLFGVPCAEHTDCSDGICVEDPGGDDGRCSRPCSADCPTGWDCRSVEFPTGPLDACVPATGRLCLACETDVECPGGSCLDIDGTRNCAPSCSSPTDCATGYTCMADAAGTHPGLFCQPVTRSCTCSAELIGVLRTCSEQNAVGACYGTQTCGATGWSGCTASTPSVEMCDGIDNDCDFLIDDGLGGEACTNANGFGSCPGIRTCAGAAGFTCNGPSPAAESCNTLDDNCSGVIDEGYPGLGNGCSDGTGTCLRFGSLRCNAPGTGVECSVVAGNPSTELCNQLDDDCDTRTDEAFTTLGTSCTVGAGACASSGTITCQTGGAGTQCNATPGQPSGETCNYLDDDCNGAVDNGFRNGTGTYDTDAHCGACGIDCTQILSGLPNSAGSCVVGGSAACGLTCSTGYFNLDAATANGCEFQLDVGSIYVSVNDPAAADDATCGLGPVATGVGNHPCRSISAGIQRAITTGRPRVSVANGTYGEDVALVSGTSVLGGYRSDTWVRDVANTTTIIQGRYVTGVHEYTVSAASITQPTVLEGFVIRGPFNGRAGGNSYAIYISSSNASLVVRGNQIFAGRGGPGSVGVPGGNGTSGTNGNPYVPSLYDAFVTTPAGGGCNASNNRAASGGGVRNCGFNADVVSGGDGGGNTCTPVRSTQTSASGSPATAGQPAESGGGTGGVAGQAGYDASLSGGSCLVPVNMSGGLLPQSGFGGASGSSGSSAAGVAGCSSFQGIVIGGHWRGGAGLGGQIAGNGGGGGGGGAGGGASGTTSQLGGHGGGGGSGGCAGGGGGEGGGGGGAFGIFISNGVAPTLINNRVVLGQGGDGGLGGLGGAGGSGGDGAPGGDIPSGLFCPGKGGRGGDGGDGGNGSGGGGGCGGGAYGIFTSGVGTPSYCATNTTSGGTSGAGGGGGFSSGNSGGAGQAGVVSTCSSI